MRFCPKVAGRWIFALTLVFLAASEIRATAVSEIKPVTPGAMPETRALLATLYAISGHYTLTGQHNYPATKDHNSEFAAKYTGRMPAIFSSDLGFAKAGDTDSYLARPDIVKEAIRQHQLGALVTLCWHAVPPTADEPVTFRPMPDSDPNHLTSVQGKLLDDQFKDLLTPGTALYKKWCAQVDEIAVFLKQLQDARVPVLWRPYHEMNGDWFWWGGRTGKYSTVALYRQLFDRLVNHHQLKNLIWVWSTDRVSKPGMEHAKFFPGIELVDILALDVYGNDFAQSYYDSLSALSGGKPVTLAEVGNPPAPEILKTQPNWIYYVTWAGMVRNTSRKQYAEIMQNPRILNLDDPRYATVMADYRKACGLPPVHFVEAPADFSGTWVLNEEKSKFGRMGAGMSPARLEIVQHGDNLQVKSTRIVEYEDDHVTEEHYSLDGQETKSEFMNSPRITTAHRTEEGKGLIMDSTVAVTWGPPNSKLTMRDTWQLRNLGDELSIETIAPSPMGEQHVTLYYDRR
jgi:mannan endo-1,4-beta-mannosidase